VTRPIALPILVGSVVLFALIASVVGLFSRSSGTPYSTTTLRGQTAQIYGQGLYRFDTVFFGAGFKGQDAVILFLGVPLLIIALLWYSRGSTAGHLLLLGVLAYFLYVYASMAVGAAYNSLFLIYVAAFAASLYGFVLSFSTFDIQSLAGLSSPPRAPLAAFMIFAGVVTLGVWGAPLVTALLSRSAPDRIDTYTTMVTYAIDLAVITPATFLCAALVFRGDPLGYFIAVPLLTLIILLAPQIVLSTVFQRAAGVPFSVGEMIGPIAGFVILGAVAAGLLVPLLRASAHAT